VVLLLAGALWWFRSDGDSVDNRPTGTHEDLRGLRDRDDVNVLFILIDTLRADRMGAYGYDRETSPDLDYLANTGIRFSENRAQSSWTKASMASLWTAHHSARSGVVRHVDAVSDDAVMPAEIFRDAGFVTGGIWRNGWVAPNFGFSQGFDVYMTPTSKQAPASLRQEARSGRIDGTDIDVIFSAEEFMRANKDSRWFLYVHLMDVHQYISTEDTAIFGDSYSDSYDNSILWTSIQVGTLVRKLYELGLGDRTLVVLASDHGEAFGEHGDEGHARDLFPEVTLTPFIISPPFKMTPPQIVWNRTQNVDIWPTVLDMLGLPGIEGADGVSWMPLLLGENGPDGKPFPPPWYDADFAQLDRHWGRLEEEPSVILAVREGPYRLIHDVEDEEKDLLFDLSTDPGELVNVVDEQPEHADRLRETAKTHLESEPAWSGGAPEVEIDEMHLRQLRALGYSIE